MLGRLIWHYLKNMVVNSIFFFFEEKFKNIFLTENMAWEHDERLESSPICPGLIYFVMSRVRRHSEQL